MGYWQLQEEVREMARELAEAQVWLRRGPLGGQEVGGVVGRQVAKVAGQGVPPAEANLALAGWLPISWISSLCADPTDSPRPKGWEPPLNLTAP